MTTIYNGVKTISSVSGAGENVQLHVKQSNWNIFLHYIQKYTQNGLKTEM